MAPTSFSVVTFTTMDGMGAWYVLHLARRSTATDDDAATRVFKSSATDGTLTVRAEAAVTSSDREERSRIVIT